MKANDVRYRITIRKWDEYQAPLKGKGERRSRRHWVAISAHLFSDPDFLKLDQCHRVVWVALLCHAGKVGPVFELCPSDARLLFRLRRSPDFHLLQNQGFIDLEMATNKQGEQTNKENKHIPAASLQMKKKKPVSKKKKVEVPEEFAYFKSAYPKRSGSQPWSRALKAINARLKEGSTWSEIIDGAGRYAVYCRETDKLETEFVMMASTFCGPEKHFLERWNPPASKTQRKDAKNKDVLLRFLENEDEQ